MRNFPSVDAMRMFLILNQKHKFATQLAPITLLESAFRAGFGLTRLDERAARSLVGPGFIKRPNSPMPALRCGSTANSFISRTSSYTTMSEIFAHQPMN